MHSKTKPKYFSKMCTSELLLQHCFAPLTKIMGSWPYKSNQYLQSPQFFATEFVSQILGLSNRSKCVCLKIQVASIRQSVWVCNPDKKWSLTPPASFILKTRANHSWLCRTGALRHSNHKPIDKVVYQPAEGKHRHWEQSLFLLHLGHAIQKAFPWLTQQRIK